MSTRALLTGRVWQVWDGNSDHVTTPLATLTVSGACTRTYTTLRDARHTSRMRAPWFESVGLMTTRALTAPLVPWQGHTARINGVDTTPSGLFVVRARPRHPLCARSTGIIVAWTRCFGLGWAHHLVHPSQACNAHKCQVARWGSGTSKACLPVCVFVCVCVWYQVSVSADFSARLWKTEDDYGCLCVYHTSPLDGALVCAPVSACQLKNVCLVLGGGGGGW
jgi:hypothetical protein